MNSQNANYSNYNNSTYNNQMYQQGGEYQSQQDMSQQDILNQGDTMDQEASEQHGEEWYRISPHNNGSQYFSVEFDSVDLPVSNLPLNRCVKCQAYINCYSEIISPGMQWKCALCETINQAEQPFVYKTNTYRQAEPVNLYNRRTFDSELLTSPIYEIEAPENFSVKTTDPPVLCFLIDVSMESRRCLLIESAVNSIKGVLEQAVADGTYDTRTRVSFFFFSEHVYVLNTDGAISVVTGAMPKLMSNDISFHLFSNPAQGQNANEVPDYTNLLDLCIQYFSNDSHANNYNNVLAAAKLASSSFRSGALYVFMSSMPNSGVSLLKQTNKFLTGEEYKKVLEILNNRQMAFNLFMCTRSALEFAQMSVVTKGGGQVFHFTNFDGGDPIYTEKLYNDLCALVNSEIFYGALMRIRTPEGCSVKRVFGNNVPKGNNLFSYANYVPSSTISFEISSQIENPIIQMAMIRIRKNGLKTIRVITLHNSGRGTSDNSIAQLALGYYQESINKEIAKSGTAQIFLDSSLKSLFNSSNPIIQQSKNLLTTYFSSYKKNLFLDSGIATDFRAFYGYLFQNAPIEVVERMSYPLLVDLENTEAQLNLSGQSLSDQGLYLLDCGINIFLFIGRSNESHADLFTSEVTSGVALFDNLSKKDLGVFMGEMITYLTGTKKLKPRFIIVHDRENSPYSEIFRKHMYDDSMRGIPDVMTYYNTIV